MRVDVRRVLSRTLTYLLLTATVLVTYLFVILVLAGFFQRRSGDPSPLTITAGTLTAVAVAAPARRGLQRALDRQFNRRRFDALTIVNTFARDPASTRAVDDVLREALSDPNLAVAYWVDDRRQWVTRDGQPVTPAEHGIRISRGAVLISVISFDEHRNRAQLVETVASAALTELDNQRLRAAISLKLLEAEQSRARIAAAHQVERRRIERDLHDGAQQRLLALGFQLRAAQLSNEPGRLSAAVDLAIEQSHAVLMELRELANGLLPAVLSDSGLSGALDDLCARAPGNVTATCTELRFAPELEAAAWFVICEAVANSLKHSGTDRVEVDVSTEPGWLVASISDDGSGGADEDGTGIRGIRDRTEATGGEIMLRSPAGRGTTIEARFPCPLP